MYRVGPDKGRQKCYTHTMTAYPLSQVPAELLSLVAAIAKECAFDGAQLALRAHKLQQKFAPQLVRAAIEIILAREKGAFIGTWVADGLLTRRAVEQSTHPLLAAHRAQYFSGCQHVLEIGSGLGVDCAAIAKVVTKLTTIESEAETAAALEHNLRLQNINNVSVLKGDAVALLQTLDLRAFDGIWADPSRRDAQGNRIMNAEDWSPPLSFVLGLPIQGVCGIKISPGWNFEQVPAGIVRQWYGLADECVEQTLWRGTHILEGSVVLPDRGLVWSPEKSAGEVDISSLDALEGHFLIEPHAALIRSGSLATFYRTRGIKLLDPQIAYGVCSNALTPEALFRAFKINEIFPYNLERLQSRIQALGWNSRTEIKKRGFPETSDEVRAQLKFAKVKSSGDPFGVIVLTRLADEHYCFLVERI